MFRACLLSAAVISAAFAQETPRSAMDRAVTDFFAGRIAESVSGFDRVAAMSPASAPHLWQRGIALYYAGRFSDCRAQFESHRLVNPNDVENAAWHFLCVARAQSPQKARAALLPVGPDSRVPMKQVLELFAGRIQPVDVARAAGSTREGQFYARLYLALYYEALGDAARSLTEIRAAADPNNAEAGGYMYEVARVHLRLREASARR